MRNICIDSKDVYDNTLTIAINIVHKQYHLTQNHFYIRNFIINSDNKILGIFHDFSMTVYSVFHDARKANTENHCAY